MIAPWAKYPNYRPTAMGLPRGSEEYFKEYRNFWASLTEDGRSTYIESNNCPEEWLCFCPIEIIKYTVNGKQFYVHKDKSITTHGNIAYHAEIKPAYIATVTYDGVDGVVELTESDQLAIDEGMAFSAFVPE